MKTATAFAPATVGNVAVGFDTLGFAMETPGDSVTVTRVDRAQETLDVVLTRITGTTELPLDPETNTAAVALAAMHRDLNPPFSLAVEVHKGIPLSAGMGGSAASAVGAVVAANALLDAHLPNDRLLLYALAGEAAASGTPHADNVSPCLWGGLTASLGANPPDVILIPVPLGIRCVLVHPHLQVDTRKARAVLNEHVSLIAHVEQSAKLAGFLAGCFRGDLGLIRRTMEDRLIEPQRAALIPGFERARSAALAAGALGCSIAGAGPSVFAWTASGAAAADVENALRRAFQERKIETDAWTAPVGGTGARVTALG